MAVLLNNFMLLACMLPLSTAFVDLTRVNEAAGTAVTRATINLIEAQFGRDNLFLRRLAFVESRDGTDPDTFRSGYYGGIWQLDEVLFDATQNPLNLPTLASAFSTIQNEFGITWPSVQWQDLRIPLYSGLGARLFTMLVPTDIPCDTDGQAEYWVTYYNRSDSSNQTFIDAAMELRNNRSMYTYVAIIHLVIQ